MNMFIRIVIWLAILGVAAFGVSFLVLSGREIRSYNGWDGFLFFILGVFYMWLSYDIYKMYVGFREKDDRDKENEKKGLR